MGDSETAPTPPLLAERSVSLIYVLQGVAAIGTKAGVDYQYFGPNARTK